MTEGKKIVFDISPIGIVRSEAFGCTGEECVTRTEEIEVVLGGEVKRKDKPERHMGSPASTAEAIKQSF